jgi:hypothetical protein
MSVTKEGDKLFAQRSGTPRARCFPNLKINSFLILPMSGLFLKDEIGKVNGMILFANGQEMKGNKIK